MKKEKQVLGRGISALISEIVSDIPNKEINEKSEREIPISFIQGNPYQPRKRFTPEALKELSDSIREHGVLQPIIVTKLADNKYQIVAGERRWKAAKEVGLSKIPAIVKNLSEQEVFEIAIVENIQRQNLTPIEEAKALRKMLVDYKHTQEILAKKIGKSRSYISNFIRLLSLPEEIQELIEDKRISVGHAKILVNSHNPKEMAEKIIEHNLSVRDLEKSVKGKRVKGERNANKDLDILEIEQSLSKALGSNVKIEYHGNNGRVIIDFSQLEVLDNIIQKLSNDQPLF